MVPSLRFSWNWVARAWVGPRREGVMKQLGILALALGAAALAALGCATAKVQDATVTGAGEAIRQQPDRVLVYDFAVSLEEVELNRSPLAAAKRSVTGEAEVSDQMKVGHMAAAALANTLVTDLEKIGIQAARWHGPPPRPGNMLLIEGAFLDVDQGNRLARTVIGFGAGGTELQTQVTGTFSQDGALEKLGEFNTVAKSKKMPGVATPAGIGAVSGVWMGVAVVGAASAVSEALGPLEGNIKDTSKQIAQYVGQRYVERGWLPAAALD